MKGTIIAAALLLLFVIIAPLTSVSAAPCTTYTASSNTIRVKCNMSFDQVATAQSARIINEGSGVFVVNSIVQVDADKTMNIESPTVSYVKITGGNGLKGIGSMYLDGVKVTSWDGDSVIGQNVDGSIVRGWILGATGTGVLDIRNSEIGYLGYKAAGKQGLVFYNSHGRLFDNDIYHNYYGVYSSGVSDLIAENNDLNKNILYGFDLHTGTTHSIFRQNSITNTVDGIGMICSLDCNNIVFEQNYFTFSKTAIMLSRNTSNSIVRDNTIIGSFDTAISIADSASNLIDNNHISNSKYGIVVKMLRPEYVTGYNVVASNDLHNIAKSGIWIRPETSYNMVYDNLIQNGHPGLQNDSLTTMLYNNTVV